MELKNTLHRWAPVISLVLFTVAIVVVYHEIQVYRWRDIRHALHNFPPSLMAMCAGLTLLSYIALSFYDYLALEYAEEKLPYRRVLFTSFLSYAISNNVGHGWLSGGSMRYRLYSGWGIPGMHIARMVLFCTITYFLGAITLLVGGYAFSPDAAVISARLPHGSVQAAVAGSSLLLVTWWALVVFYRKPVAIGGFSLAIPGFSLALRQLLAALLDLSLASLVMYVSLAHFTAMPFGDFLVLYLFAQLAGLISMLPGGIGIFEGSFIFLASGHYSAPHIIAALIIYRTVYYFMPLLLAGLLLAIYELQLYRIVRHRLVSAAIDVIESAIPQIFAVLLMLGGSVLLLSGATPALKERLGWLKYLIPLPVMELSHLVGSVVGVGLLLLSQAVWRRIDAAYFVAIALLVLGMVASLGKGLDYEEALFLGVMLAVFIPLRKHFYRKSALLQLDLSPQWLLLAAIVVLGSTWLGFFSYKHVEYSNELWWQFALHGDASRFLRSLVAILVVVTGLAAYRLMTRASFVLALPTAAELDRAAAITREADETSAQLALTGDKYLLWSESGRSFIMYAVTERYWVAMGDPVGPAEEHEELAWELRTLADRHNAGVAFYQVGTQHLPLYLDLGLALLKLGEEARVPLDDFSLSGSSRASLRHAYNRLQREGWTFEIVPAADVDAILPELQAVSDHWLNDKQAREKRFSIGAFDADYLRRCTIALARKEGRILAFANLWELDNRNELSMDLMRYEPGSANGLMEYLIVSLLLWGKEQGYHWFNLGMAPLSGLELRPLAPLWSKVGNTIFRFGSEFYNFDGLYQYKNKFDPVWQPRYLAAPAGLSMATALLAVTTLISGKLKGVFGK
ncbi:MAG TPA: bifunctional lysylphosphatidylglycerol flippase/synthetase MprF [Gallionellaceae bacterium]